MKPLNRQKLEVAKKTRSNLALRGWGARLTPEFVAIYINA
jgi:hypothetical protein